MKSLNYRQTEIAEGGLNMKSETKSEELVKKRKKKKKKKEEKIRGFE